MKDLKEVIKPKPLGSPDYIYLQTVHARVYLSVMKDLKELMYPKPLGSPDYIHLQTVHARLYLNVNMNTYKTKIKNNAHVSRHKNRSCEDISQCNDAMI